MITRLIARLMILVALMAAFSTPSVAAEAEKPAPGSFMALCYHNVEDEDPDQTYDGVTTGKLIEQLSWLQHEGYTAITVDDLLAARAGKKALPEKSVLLSFDDGYESFYTRVYPVLRAFHFPAVIAVVDEWMATKPGHGAQAGDRDRVHYGDSTMPRKAFLTWAQLREMKKSGLIEIASHSHAMHYGVTANPQGNSEPDALTSVYDPATGTYETSEHYVKRLQADAAASVATIKKNTGKAPRVMVWPYGAYNEIGMLIQNQNGMPVTLSLEDGYASVNTLKSTPRMLVKDDPNIGEFSILIRQVAKVQPIRMIQVSLDDVYNADADQEARNVDALISRVHDMNINTIYLQAFSDPTGSGVAKEVYFPNRYLPVRQDLFNRVAWQLETRTTVHVYGWLPVVSFDFGTGSSATFDADTRSRIVGLYEDFGRHDPVDGLLFRDPAMTIDGTIAETDAVIQFTKELASHVEAYRAPLKLAATLYAPVDRETAGGFGIAYDRFLASYDYTVVEAKPGVDGDEWIKPMIKMAAERPKGLKKTVFGLQAVEGRAMEGGEPVSTDTLASQMKLLATRGALNFGYYHDHFATNVPDADALHKDFSLQAYPYLP